ncbi:MAG: hypothetical protein JWL77_3459 [Chthonomonadaceae bacterium]|nr:hypothetical protein [Chthonomonadaceae bacterium]
MVRLNLDLPDALSHSLAVRAAREGQSPDEFVLHSLERILGENAEDPLLQVLGTLEADTPDLGQNHDEYLAHALNARRG